MALIRKIGEDTIAKLERAAEARFAEAEWLAEGKHYLGSIYFYGYVAEIVLGTAYFRVLGYKATQPIEDERRRRVLIAARKQSLAEDRSHPLDGLAKLLVNDKGPLSPPAYSEKMGLSIVEQASRVMQNWGPKLRYRTSKPSLNEWSETKRAAELVLEELSEALSEVDMPVVRQTQPGEPTASLKKHLVEVLKKELMGERTPQGPVIFELPTAQDTVVDVIVVWEAWKGLSESSRVEIVRAAYDQYARDLAGAAHSIDFVNPPPEPIVPKVAVVITATWEDLTTFDLLPYKIEPTAREGEYDPEDAELLMIEIGAIQTPFGVQLRLPNEEMAGAVLSRLVAEMPEARWSIVESSFGPIME